MGRRLIIYDLDEVNEKKLINICKDDMIFSANPMLKHCIGCFGCWINTPGKCVIKDRCDVMTSYIPYGSSDEDEKDIARSLVRANAVNLGAGDFYKLSIV